MDGVLLEISGRAHIQETTQGFEICISYMEQSYLISGFKTPKLAALGEEHLIYVKMV